MKITTATVIILALSCLQVGRIIVQLKRDAIRIKLAVIWLTIWTGIGLGAIFPHLFDVLMDFAMMESRTFFLILIAILILFAMIFNIISRISANERNTAKIIQEVALMRYHLEESKKGD